MTTQISRRIPSLGLLALASLAFLSGCDDAGENSETHDTGEHADHGDSTSGGGTAGDHDQGTGTTGEDPGVQPHGSVAVITQIFTAEERISYIVQAPSLGAGVVLDLAQGIELPGRAIGAGPGAQSLFIGGSGSANLERYTLDGAGVLQPDGAASFINAGVSAIGEYQSQLQFAGADRAFFFDGGTGQVIPWNPTELTVSTGTQIPGAVMAGTISTFATVPVVDGDTLYFPMGWRGDDNLSIVALTGVLVVDTITGQHQLVTDTRCGYARDAAMGPDGKLYLATEAYASAVYRLNAEAAPPPCMLRFDPATRSFDPNFQVNLSDLVGGATAGSLIVGTEGQAYLRVLDEGLAGIDDETHPRALASRSAWTWSQLTLGDQVTAANVAGLPVSGGSTLVFHVGGHNYFPHFAPDYSETTFLSLDQDNAGAESGKVPGLVFSVVDL